MKHLNKLLLGGALLVGSGAEAQEITVEPHALVANECKFTGKDVSFETISRTQTDAVAAVNEILKDDTALQNEKDLIVSRNAEAINASTETVRNKAAKKIKEELYDAERYLNFHNANFNPQEESDRKNSYGVLVEFDRHLQEADQLLARYEAAIAGLGGDVGPLNEDHLRVSIVEKVLRQNGVDCDPSLVAYMLENKKLAAEKVDTAAYQVPEEKATSQTVEFNDAIEPGPTSDYIAAGIDSVSTLQRIQITEEAKARLAALNEKYEALFGDIAE